MALRRGLCAYQRLRGLGKARYSYCITANIHLTGTKPIALSYTLEDKAGQDDLQLGKCFFAQPVLFVNGVYQPMLFLGT
jgi:hypothetical protein